MTPQSKLSRSTFAASVGTIGYSELQLSGQVDRLSITMQTHPGGFVSTRTAHVMLSDDDVRDLIDQCHQYLERRTK